MLASGLSGKPNSFINSDVALDGEPVIGSFTVDGLTYAVIDESTIELVGVVPSVILSEGSEAAGVEESNESNASEAGVASLPETVTYANITYTLASIAPYAFYLSGVTDVELPASVSDVDDRAFRSSDVANVSVAEGNQGYSSFDGALYSADKTRLLLIPEGRVGAVLLPREAEVADPGKFSHCSLVDAISVEDGAAFASENGLLYTSDLATLLRVPAGATEITIREGCTTIAAGALEACAKLATINAPATITSISPDVFHAIPTVSLPAASVILSEGAEGPEVEGSNEGQADEAGTQLTAMVALSSTDDDLPEIDSAAIKVSLSEMVVATPWEALGFAAENSIASVDLPEVEMQTALSSRARSVTTYANGLYARNSYDGLVAWYPNDRFHWPDADTNTFIFYPDATMQWNPSGANWRITFANPECEFVCYSTQRTYPGGTTWTSRAFNTTLQNNVYAIWRVPITWDANGGYWSDDCSDTQNKTDTYYSNDPTSGWQGSIVPTRPGYRFAGWQSIPPVSNVSQLSFAPGEDVVVSYAVTYVAQWEQSDLDIGFDVDSEPGDEDYSGEPKDDQTVAGEQIEAGDKVEIADPKRPGYVFQGWTIPDAEGAEAIDQDLVYQDETDGKWYVDASKLPDYAGDDGRVELTARWTSVISVDVPSSVTFYADVVTQGNESREGLASSAFGQNRVVSQSEVDLRIVGLESKQVKGNGSTSLGASDILKKKDGSDLPATSDKLFSLYPATGELTEDDLKDPDVTSTSKPAGAVDFSLDDILLEKSFAADEFTIPAGDTLSLGYRLNLQETSTELNYDKLSTLSEGSSASITNISYCFAADYNSPADWGEPLWIENPDASAGAPRFLVLDDIKAAADDLSANGTSSTYYSMYKGMLDRQVMTNGNPGEGPYFHLKVEGAVGGYLDLQLIGICQDTKSDGSGKAGLTFQTRDIYAYKNTKSIAAGGSTFNYTYMNSVNTNSGGWASYAMRNALRTTFWGYLPERMQMAIVGVDKHHQLYGGSSASYLQKTTDETIWLPSSYEVFGVSFANYNESETLTNVSGYEPFQYIAYQGSSSSTVNNRAVKTYDGSVLEWWLRSADRSGTVYCSIILSNGGYGGYHATSHAGTAPCFCL